MLLLRNFAQLRNLCDFPLLFTLFAPLLFYKKPLFIRATPLSGKWQQLMILHSWQTKKKQYSLFKLIILHKKISKYLDQFYLIIYILIVGVYLYFEELSLSQRKDYFQNRFYGRPKMADISSECILLISAPLKCLVYASSENSFYDKTLPLFT